MKQLTKAEEEVMQILWDPNGIHYSYYRFHYAFSYQAVPNGS